MGYRHHPPANRPQDHHLIPRVGWYGIIYRPTRCPRAGEDKMQDLNDLQEIGANIRARVDERIAQHSWRDGAITLACRPE
jgi:hypothetical protein